MINSNEYFGELPRPMRGRGIEIYLNEFNFIANKDDEKLILKSLYSFTDFDFQFYFDQLTQIKQSFAQMIKVFKMIYDFSLLDGNKTAVDSFIKATNELKINTDSAVVQNETVSKFKHFFSDICKLKESIAIYSIFQYLDNLFNSLEIIFKQLKT